MTHSAASLTALLAHPDEPLRAYLEHRVLPGWLPARRWFRAKSRPLRAVVFEAVFPCGDATITVLRVDFADSFTDHAGGNDYERYLLPLALTAPQTADTLPEAAVLGPVTTPAGIRLLIDACWDAGFRQAFAERLCEDDGIDGENGNVGGGGDDSWRGRPADGLSVDVLRRATRLPSRVLGAEQSNTAFVYDGGRGRTSGAAPLVTETAGPETSGMFVKLYRRLEPGIHPEPEMLRFLRERTGYRGVPGFLAAMEWSPRGGAPATIALAQELVPDGRDAWTFVVEALGKTFVEASEAMRNKGAAAPRSAPATLADLASFAAPTFFAARLGAAVGGLHAALGSRADDPAFAPAAMAAGALDAVRANTREGLRTALTALESRLSDLTPEPAAAVRRLRAHGARLEALLTPDTGHSDADTAGLALRTHGDLHLGQILVAGDDIRILDFEGEPGRPLAAARRKQSPLRDVAGMLRSFHYAAHVAERDFRGLAERDFNHRAEHESATVVTTTPATNDADTLAAKLAKAFLEAYYAVPGLAPLLPREAARRDALLSLHVLEKAVYELRYELDNRPDWISIPLQGLVSLCNDSV